MCGIFGIVVKEPNENNYTQFRKLMAASVHRGRDAAGLVVITNKKEIILHKKPLKPAEYLEKELPQFKDAINSGIIVLGHIREASQGDPKDNNNNHPVESDNWIIIHNGTLSSLPKIEGYKYKGEVDTEILLSYIETGGLQEGLSYLGYGSGAIVLVNKKDPTFIVFARHISPIYVALNNEKTIFSFASEESILKIASENYFCFFNNCKFGSVPEGIAYLVSQSPLEAKLIFPFEIKSAPKTTSYNNGEYHWYRWLKEKSGNSKRDKELERWDSVPDIIPVKIKGDGRDIYYFNPLLRIWTTKASVVPLLPSVPNRYYFDNMSKDFKNWTKVAGDKRGWMSLDQALYKKYDGKEKKHFIISSLDALLEGEITFINELTHIKREKCQVRIFLNEKDEIVGYSLTKDEIDKIEGRVPTKNDDNYGIPYVAFIDISDIVVDMLLMCNRKDCKAPEILTRYAVESIDLLENEVLSVLLADLDSNDILKATDGKEEKECIYSESGRCLIGNLGPCSLTCFDYELPSIEGEGNESNNTLPNPPVVQNTEVPCAGYDPLINKTKVLTCNYCKNYIICYPPSAENTEGE